VKGPLISTCDWEVHHFTASQDEVIWERLFVLSRLSRIEGRRKANLLLNHAFSADSKKVYFVSIALIFMEILGKSDCGLSCPLGTQNVIHR
jgi:hypothetical protein